MSDQLGLLQQHFDTALESPDGIKKLRELILTLAMQGKLVKQDPKDQPASELLKEIQVEKERLIKEGKIKKQKELAEIKPEEVPYQVPSGWEWVRLGEIVLSITGGGTPSKNNSLFWNGTIPWASVKDLNVDVFISSTIDHITENAITSSSTNLIPKNRVIVCTRMGLGKIAINTVEMAINQDLKALELSGQIDQMFFFKKFKNYQIIGTGMTVAGIRQEELLSYLFPLPPLAEQKRIVAKINELMALCDKLEAQRNARNDKRLAVHTAAISRLLTAADTNDFDSAWQFITRHFDPLYSVKENVAELKKAILTLAMQGKLVKQDPKDQPASELLKEIQAEKERLIKEGKIKKQKELPPIKLEEVPYQVPSGWEWVRLGEVGIINPRNDTMEDSVISGFVPMPLISEGMANIHSFEERPWSEIKKGYTHFADGDVGMAKITPCFENAKSCVFRGLPNGVGAGTTELHIFRNTFNSIVPVFLLFYLKNPRFLAFAESKMTGSAGQKRVPTPLFTELLFPLPPLAEQKRIVAKIDELMALCDKLEKQIDQATAKQTALFDAVLAKV